MQKYILITRPKDKALALKKELETLGYKTLIAPLLEPKPLAAPAIEYQKNITLIFTSSTSFSYLDNIFTTQKKSWLNLPIFTIGKATTKAAKNYGFKNIQQGKNNAKNLAEIIKSKNNKNQKYIHLGGKDIAFNIEKTLSKSGLDCSYYPIYKSNRVDILPPHIIDKLYASKISSILFFSARTAAQFLDLIKKHTLETKLANIKFYVLSPNIAKILYKEQKISKKAIRTAREPTKKSLIKLLNKDNPKER